MAARAADRFRRHRLWEGRPAIAPAQGDRRARCDAGGNAARVGSGCGASTAWAAASSPTRCSALHKLRDLGVRIWVHDKREITLDTATDEIAAAMMAGLARMENEVRAGKLRANYDRKRAAGLPLSPHRAHGLRLDPVTKKDVPVEPHAEIIGRKGPRNLFPA
jgi:hypothetical protein